MRCDRFELGGLYNNIGIHITHTRASRQHKFYRYYTHITSYIGIVIHKIDLCHVHV